MKTRPSPSGCLRSVLVLSLFLATCLCLQAEDRNSQTVNAGSPAMTASTEQPRSETQPARVPAYESPWIDELTKLARAGIDENIILAYVDAAGTFNLGSEQIISLREQGVSDAVITAILVHDATYISGAPQNPPAPPASALQKLRLSAKFMPDAVKEKSPPAPQPSDLGEPTTIVHPTPAEEFEPWLFLPNMSFETRPRVSEATMVMTAQQPVRRPDPVQLTDTIYVYRTAWRTPNIQILRSLP